MLIEDTLAQKRSIKGKRGSPLSPAAAWERVHRKERRDTRKKPFADVSAVLRALEKNPRFDEARTALAACVPEGWRAFRGWVKDVSDARQKLRKWVEECKGTDLEAVAAGLVGAVRLYSEQKPKEAIPYLEAAHSVEPEHEEIAFDLATAYTMADMADEALRVLEKSDNWKGDIVRPEACGNFRKLWGDPRFRAIVGEPDPRCERFLCQPQIRIMATTGPSPVPRDVGPHGQESMETPEVPEELTSRLEELLGCGPLLSISSVHRLSKGDVRARRPKAKDYAVLEVAGKGAAAIPVAQAVSELVLWGFRPFPDRQPQVPLAVSQVLEAAGITLESVVLLKRSRRGIEGALITSNGRRQDAIAIAGLHGLAVALAAERPILITDSLAEKLYVRGKSGRPLTPRGAKRKLLSSAG